MYKKISAGVVILSLLGANIVIANDEQLFHDARTRITQLQGENPALPAGTDPQGAIGGIISRMFQSNGTIRPIFVADLPATKITSGQFDSARIPNLDASKITTGNFDFSRISNVVLTTDMIPDLDAAKITTGNFDFSRIANVSITSSMIADNAITNSKVAPNAAISGSKISPNFGNQNITTTGNAGIGTLSPERQLHVNQITNGPVGLRLQSNFFNVRGIVDFEPRSMGGGRLVLGVGNNESNTGENPFFFTRQGNFGAGVRWSLMGSSDIGVFPSALMGQAESSDAYVSEAANNRPSESDVITLYNHGTQDDIETWAGIYMGTRGGGVATRRGARIAVVPDMNRMFASDIVFQATRYHDARLYERLRIQGDSGNVGIGTTSPSARLHVIGDVRVNNILSQDNSGVKGILGGSNAAGGANILLYGSQNNTHPNTISLNSGLTPRLTVHGGSGNVGIGIPVPTERLDVNGNIRANAFLHSSDRYLKTDIIPYTDGQKVIAGIETKRYNWKDTGISDIGVIAQDVQKVFPEAVSQGEDGTLAVDYAKLVVPLLQVTREQQKEIDMLKKIIIELYNNK